MNRGPMVAIVIYVVYATFFLTVAFGVKARFGAESPAFYMTMFGLIGIFFVVVTHKGLNDLLERLDGNGTRPLEPVVDDDDD